MAVIRRYYKVHANGYGIYHLRYRYGVDDSVLLYYYRGDISNLANVSYLTTGATVVVVATLQNGRQVVHVRCP